MNISRHILNEALDLSLGWDRTDEKLHQRIKGLFPELSKEGALDIEKLCKDVLRHAKSRAKVAADRTELMNLIAERYNFISKENLENLSRQVWFWVNK